MQTMLFIVTMFAPLLVYLLAQERPRPKTMRLRYLFVPIACFLALWVTNALQRSVVDAEFIEQGRSVIAPGPVVVPPPLPAPFSMTPEPANAITLQRTRCYGACPAYVLRIEPSGKVSFSSGPPFQPGGLHTSTIAPEQYRDLVAKFSEIHFADFKDVYPPSATDLPEAYIQLTVDGKSKQVKHSNVSPPGLDELERTIERVANIHRWLHDASQRLTLQNSARYVGQIEDLKNDMVVSDDAYTRIKPAMTELMQTAGGGGLEKEALAAQRQMRHPSRADVAGWIVDRLNIELKRGDAVNAADESGWTALMVASVVGQPESASALLDAGAIVNQRDKHADTALIGAAAVRYRDLSVAAQVVKLLLAHGAAPDITNDMGETALMWAARSGNPEVIQTLLAAGANPARLDKTGHDALFYLRRARAELTFDPALVHRYDAAESLLNRK